MKIKTDVQLLISEVHKRPVLWYQQDKDYNNRRVLQENWEDVAKIINQPTKKLRKKWKGLRDQFRIELKKLPIIKWCYFKSLMFLKDQLRTRNPNGNFAPPIHTYNDESSVDENIEAISISSTDTEDPNTIPVKWKMTIDTNDPTRILSNEQNKLELLEERVNSESERNDDKAFLESLLPYFQNMNLKQKLLCRMDMQRIIYNYAFTSSGIVSQHIANSGKQSFPPANVQTMVVNEPLSESSDSKSSSPLKLDAVEINQIQLESSERHPSVSVKLETIEIEEPQVDDLCKVTTY